MLSLLIFLPLLFGVVVLFIKKPSVCRRMSLFFSGAYWLFSLILFFIFKPQVKNLQLVEQVSWFPDLGVQYFVGIDGLSFWFVILTAFLSPICVLASWNLIQEKVSFFYACLFFMSTSLMGTFLAMDACLFYVFFESSLVPLYFIIGIWGGEKKLYAAFKFFIYTAFGSLFLLTAILALMNLHFQETGYNSASLLDFYKLEIPFIKGYILSTQNILFLCVFLAFAIKLPFFPFHTWLPLAHVQAPAPGSAVLAGLILKMGSYGFLRFLLPIFPQSVEFFSSLISLLAGVGIAYGALMALAQTNIKKLVAYSSISHMAYVLLGLFSLNIYGLLGGFYQMLSHALSSAGLFLLVGMIYERTHSLQIKAYQGLAKQMPWLCIFFVLLSLSAIAFPSTGGFVSEFLVLLGAFTAHNKLALIFALTGVVLGAVYMLYLIHRVFFGPIKDKKNLLPSMQSIKELSLREKILLIPFVCLIFAMGIFPKAFFKYSEASLNHLLSHRENYQLEIYKSLKTKTNTGELK